MARKFVSGVLAFAMVFGATAPVVFAEPVATEVVDQDASYLPTLEKSELTMAADDVFIVKVTDIGSTADITKYEDSEVSVEYLKASKSLLVTCKKELSADSKKIELTIDHSATSDEYGAEKLTLTIKKPVTNNVTGWGTKAISLVPGKSESFEIQVNSKAPKSVDWKLTTAASQYFTVTKTDKVVNGEVTAAVVTLTGVKTIPDSEKETVAIKLIVNGVEQPQREVKVGKADAAAALTLKASKSSLTANNTDVVTFVAQAYITNDYGELVTDDEKPVALEWTVNGKTPDASDNIMNAKGNAVVATLTGTKNVKTFTASEAGEYVITVSDVAGAQKKTFTVTAKAADEAQKLYVADSKTNLKYGDAAKNETVVKPGSTVELGNVLYAATTTTTPSADTVGALMSTFSGWTASYSIANTTFVSSYDAKTGKVNLVDKNDADLAAELKAHEKATVTVNVIFSKTGKSDLILPYDIVITEAGAKAKTITVTDGADFKAVAGKGNGPTNAEENNTNYVMAAGTTVEFSAVATDENGFTDVKQDMIWSVEKTDAADTDTKPATIAVNNGGKLTALTENPGKVTFVGVSASNPSLKVKIQLYITAATATPTPAPTATAEPTVTPAPTATAEPTKAPATKTGKVTASSLRVRETPVNGTVVGKLAKGTAVTITEEKDGWYKVTAGTLNGWVSGEYVEIVTPSTNETAKTTANLRLRKTAPNGTVITKMPKGSKVEVLEKGTEWSKVKYNGKTGFASNAYLEFEEDAVG